MWRDAAAAAAAIERAPVLAPSTPRGRQHTTIIAGVRRERGSESDATRLCEREGREREREGGIGRVPAACPPPPAVLSKTRGFLTRPPRRPPSIGMHARWFRSFLISNDARPKDAFNLNDAKAM